MIGNFNAGEYQEEKTRNLSTFKTEFHVHTVLSPCASVEMIPPIIVEAALKKHIQLIAITDHNASANIISVQNAAKNTGLTVLPGMEIQTKEEVHVLCIFDTNEQIKTWQEYIDKYMPDIQNNPEYFGEQFVVDETGEFIRRENRLLINSCSLSFNEIITLVNQMGGLPIPAHVDRQVFGLFANLGFIPPDLPIDILEISRKLTVEGAKLKFPQLSSYPLVIGGDVHFPDDFLGANFFHIKTPTIKEIKMALSNQDGRYMTIHPNTTDNYPNPV